MLGMAAAVQSGIGLGVLPCYLADAWTGVVRVGEPIPELATDLWLLTHPDLRRINRIRAFMEYVGEALKDRLASPQKTVALPDALAVLNP